VDPWLSDTLQSPIESLARGQLRDIDAVRAAVIMPWIIGAVAGKINKLKLIIEASRCVNMHAAATYE